MKRVSDQKAKELAKKYVWWKTPEDALADETHFIAQLMTLGTLEDTQWLRGNFSDDELREVLNQAPPGVFNGRAWHYWHLRLKVEPVPGLPERRVS